MNACSNKDNFTFLDNKDVAAVLIENGHDVNFVNKDGRTPLDLAAAWGNFCILMMYLKMTNNVCISFKIF